MICKYHVWFGNERLQNNVLLLSFIMEINILGLLATALFIIIPTSFLIILYASSSKQKSS